MSIVQGSLKGIKPSQHSRLEKLGARRISPDKIVTQEFARTMTELSFELGQQIGVLVDRKGKIFKVLVGDAKSILIPKLNSWRVGSGRLRGLRFIHTHLKNEPLSQEDLTDLSLLRFDLVAAIGLDSQGFPKDAYIAHVLPPNPEGNVYETLPPIPPSQLDTDFLGFVKALEDEIDKSVKSLDLDKSKERAYIIGRTVGREWEIEESLNELIELAKSSGLQVVGTAIQRRDSVDPHFVVGKGKLRQIVVDALQKGAGLMIFDTELTPAQVKAIADFTELKVLDRSQLILDIFAQRAKSREGKLQVELAQLKYALPGLREKDDALSRLTGGIGGRGPGETSLEIDRRRIHTRITFLEKQIEKISKNRALRRGLRNRRHVPVISIVGYTNAGKSTLLNKLTKSRILVEDKLFATLDPTSRRLRFPRETEVIITDTVGFIHELPEELFTAFSATLDELRDADVLLHIIDCSNPAFEKQLVAVEKILERLDLSQIPLIRVFNKTDLVPDEVVQNICFSYNGLPISAINSKTFPPLIQKLEDEVISSLNRNSDFVELEDDYPRIGTR
ncbi:MAG: GTPase HflX [Syntrophaceae bacterium]|nr:GTPase HflX [Syntrophaceae bacterium]